MKDGLAPTSTLSSVLNVEGDTRFDLTYIFRLNQSLKPKMKRIVERETQVATFQYSKERILELLDAHEEKVKEQLAIAEASFRDAISDYLKLLPARLGTWISNFDIGKAVGEGYVAGPHFEGPHDYDFSPGHVRLYHLRTMPAWLKSIRARVELMDSKDGRIRISERDDLWRAILSDDGN